MLRISVLRLCRPGFVTHTLLNWLRPEIFFLEGTPFVGEDFLAKLGGLWLSCYLLWRGYVRLLPHSNFGRRLGKALYNRFYKAG